MKKKKQQLAHRVKRKWKRNNANELVALAQMKQRNKIQTSVFFFSWFFLSFRCCRPCTLARFTASQSSHTLGLPYILFDICLRLVHFNFFFHFFSKIHTVCSILNLVCDYFNRFCSTSTKSNVYMDVVFWGIKSGKCHCSQYWLFCLNSNYYLPVFFFFRV